ncbi:hypothetical protein B0H14DRAFT_2566633 [Mycena olivaceomarginata]|nr:hypothetical protein B0H14DRAFT_2566633 [Mycena olivaceomarginata]
MEGAVNELRGRRDTQLELDALGSGRGKAKAPGNSEGREAGAAGDERGNQEGRRRRRGYQDDGGGREKQSTANVCKIAVNSNWPELWVLVDEERGGKSVSVALETGDMSSLPALRKPSEPAVASTSKSKNPAPISEYFNPVKISIQRIICCALPFALLGNPFFIEFVFDLAPKYKVPDRTSFFARMMVSDVAAVGKKLQDFLSTQMHMTLSLDGWSSRAKDEIYTFHNTIPSRRSFFVDGHVFKGISVTGATLAGVIQKWQAMGGPNVRAAKRIIAGLFPWILNIYDPCHNLNLLMKDIGTLFKTVMFLVRQDYYNID